MADSSPDVGTSEPPGVDRGSLLLVARRSDAGAHAYCRDHLSGGATGSPSPLVVLTDRPPGPEDRFPDLPGVVVTLDDATRSAGPIEVPPAPPAQPETVVAGGDLPTVGSTVDRYLTTWASAGHRPLVCVDSLAGLVDRSTVRASYRFLYVLRRRVERAGGAVHAHAEPHGHEEEILRTFYPLFDRVVSFSGGPSVPPY